MLHLAPGGSGESRRRRTSASDMCRGCPMRHPATSYKRKVSLSGRRWMTPRTCSARTAESGTQRLIGLLFWQQTLRKPARLSDASLMKNVLSLRMRREDACG
jgi:hypothetical protein